MDELQSCGSCAQHLLYTLKTTYAEPLVRYIKDACSGAQSLWQVSQNYNKLLRANSYILVARNTNARVLERGLIRAFYWLWYAGLAICTNLEDIKYSSLCSGVVM